MMSNDKALQDADLIDFLQENKPNARRSVLAPYKEQILYMKNQDFTEQAILDFLKQKKNITVSQPTLNAFIKKHNHKKTQQSQPAKKAVVVEKVVKKNDTPTQQQDHSTTFLIKQRTAKDYA